MDDPGIEQTLPPREDPISISLIMTCYCEEESVREFHRRLSGVLAGMTIDGEIIYVDDGSRDGTLEALRQIALADSRVKLVAMERNNGQWAAMTWGFLHACKNDILFMDVDLEIAPEEIPPFLAAYQQGADTVSAHRVKRADRFSRMALSKIGNFFIRHGLGIGMTDLGSGLKIFDRRILAACQLSQQRPLNPIDVFTQPGTVANIPVRYSPRHGGESHWPVRQVVWRFLDSFRLHLQAQQPGKLRRLCALLGLVATGAAAAAGVIGLLPPPALRGPGALMLAGCLLAVAAGSVIAMRFLRHPSKARAACAARVVAQGGRLVGAERPVRSPEVTASGATDIEFAADQQ
ncbi:MAG: glycosyltransferase family 2 protein [Candidatus Hydrogenedentes bacterium]|nr:glycosyltransferase family 2 protein [Candidatus Hydrogenedentota bacterium]